MSSASESPAPFIGQVTSSTPSMGKEGNGDSHDPSTRPKRVKVYPEPVKRVRAKKPKTRTGCKTCKQVSKPKFGTSTYRNRDRRVKCGEERPSCLRCVKIGMECDGYTKPVLPPQSTRTKRLLPRAVCNIPLAILPTTALFSNQIEHQYFLHFRDEVALELSGPIQTNIWNYIILQATHETVALRSLTISIAALEKSKSSSSEGNSHRAFAIRQYGKALSELRQILTRSDDTAVRISLIASLLIFCFENIHGDHEQAVSQLRCALAMMRRRLSTYQKPYSKLRTISSIPGFEDDIVDVFVRLDNTIMARVADPTESRASVLEIDYLQENVNMPREFHDIAEAKTYLEHVQFKAMPYMAHMPDILMYGDNYNVVLPREAYDEITLHLQLWIRAFQPWLDDASRRGGLDFIAAATLRVLTLATIISTQRIFLGAANTKNPGLFVAEAKEIVLLTRRIITERGFKKGFVVDCGIVPSLFVVITICRNRMVREDAIAVLESCGERMEVTWNAAAVAKIGKQILEAGDGIFL